MKIIVGVFPVEQQAVTRAELLLELRLEEEVTVPLPVLVAETARFLPYAGSRVSPFRIVEIGLNLPVATLYETEKPHLDPFHPDIPVMAVSGSIVTALGSVCEAVTSVSVHILGRSAQGQPVAELVLQKAEGFTRAKDPVLKPRLRLSFFPGENTGILLWR